MIRWLFLIGVLSATVFAAGGTPAHAQTPSLSVRGKDPVIGQSDRQASAESHLLPIQFSSSQRDIPNATGTAGQPFPLRVEIPDEYRQAKFLVIRGVPNEMSLSAGFRAGAAWYVPFEELPGLEVISPADFTGNFVFDATLYKELQGGPIGQMYVTFAIRAPRPGAVNTAVTGTTDKAPPRRQGRKPLTSADERAALARGAGHLQNGDVSTARMVFLDLAKRGSSQGARAMGETYDPVFLSRIFIQGLRPDPAEARRWYALALEMGDKEAEKRLAALGPP